MTNNKGKISLELLIKIYQLKISCFKLVLLREPLIRYLLNTGRTAAMASQGSGFDFRTSETVGVAPLKNVSVRTAERDSWSFEPWRHAGVWARKALTVTCILLQILFVIAMGCAAGTTPTHNFCPPHIHVPNEFSWSEVFLRQLTYLWIQEIYLFKILYINAWNVFLSFEIQSNGIKFHSSLFIKHLLPKIIQISQ